MNTFYSILYCTLRPNIDERVSIGLVVADECSGFFNYSGEKLQAIKHLLSDDAYHLVKTTIKSLNKIVAECNGNNSPGAYRGHSVLKETYFNYLANYSNNLVTYSPPVAIDIPLNQKIFNRLFEKFVHRLPPLHVEKVKPIERAKQKLHSSISRHVNFDVELDEQKVPGLVIPSKLWFIGKNDVEVTGEAKDFNSPLHILQPQISAHLFLIDKIKATKHGRNGHFFFLGDEPSKDLKENHKLWDALRKDKTLDIVPTSEVERIERYMAEHGVEPMFG